MYVVIIHKIPSSCSHDNQSSVSKESILKLTSFVSFRIDKCKDQRKQNTRQ